MAPRLSPIAGDNEDAPQLFYAALRRLRLSDTAHVLAFCRSGLQGDFSDVCEAHGLKVRRSLVWVKANHTAGDLRGSFAPNHERIIHASFPGARMIKRNRTVFTSRRTVRATRHPTEKPTDLLRYLIHATTIPGQVVVDPFAGVASTLVAAKELGRNYAGVELDPTHHATGIERLRNATLIEGTVLALQCDECGRTYTARRRTSGYCSGTCRQRAFRATPSTFRGEF